MTCWGDGWTGRLGYETVGNQETPVESAVEGVTQVAAGSAHTCVLLVSGGVRCFGDNRHGQGGYGHADEDFSLPDTDVLTDAVAVTAGRYHSCALIRSRHVLCWGYNEFGQLAYGDRLAATSSAAFCLRRSPEPRIAQHV